MYDDELMTRSPFAVVDRGLQLLKGVGRLKTGDPNDTRPNRVLIMDTESAKILREGLGAANEARRLNPPEEIEVKEKNGTNDR
jgi:hypothetical protein